MYYWCKEDSTATDTGITRSNKKHYVTLGRGTNVANWWSQNNAWYHYDDIRNRINEDNKDKFEQAKDLSLNLITD